MKKNNKKWMSEKAGLSVMASAICGKNVPVRDVDIPNCVAYTAKDGIIRLSEENDLFNGLSEAEKIAARRGICAHEVLHLVKTDFDWFNRIIRKIPKHHREVFANINNIVEDCAIENQAEDTIGGYTLDALDFIIAHTYKVSPNLEDAEDEFSQFIIALSQFGDLGVPKGRFTFENAKRIFIKISPIFKAAIEEPCGARRVEYSKQIFELSKPLWEEAADKYNELMKKRLEELMKNLGVNLTEGVGAGQDSSGAGKRSSSEKKSKRQKLSIKIITEEEKKRLLEEMKNGSGESSDSGSESGTAIAGEEGKGKEASGNFEGTLLMTEEDLKKQIEELDKAMKEFTEANGDSSSSERSDDESSDGSDGKNGSSENDDKANSSENRNNKTNINLNEKLEDSYGDHNEKAGNDAHKKTYEGSTMHSESDLSGDTCEKKAENLSDIEISEEEYILDSECAEQLLSEVESALESLEKRMLASDDESDIDLNSITVDSPYFKEASCKNISVTVSDADRLSDGYSKLMEGLNGGVKILTKQFERIFMNDTEELTYKNSGSTSIRRMYSGKVTSRIFEKRRLPSNKNDFAVFLLIDESGSMGGLKAQIARNTAISFAEVFGKLNIPLYVMGFTADCGADAVHNHYIKWKNTPATRLRLMDISARSNNFDGYSIRYATEILKKKQAKHKLLLVVSDGAPACYKYNRDGIVDTKDAIKQAKKIASVMGVGIGNVNTDVFLNMYGNDFLHIENVTSLYTTISKKLTKLVREWE